MNADGRNLVAEWAPSAVWPLASPDWTLNSSANALCGGGGLVAAVGRGEQLLVDRAVERFHDWFH